MLTSSEGWWHWAKYTTITPLLCKASCSPNTSKGEVWMCLNDQQSNQLKLVLCTGPAEPPNNPALTSNRCSLSACSCTRVHIRKVEQDSSKTLVYKSSIMFLFHPLGSVTLPSVGKFTQPEIKPFSVLLLLTGRQQKALNYFTQPLRYFMFSEIMKPYIGLLQILPANQQHMCSSLT